MNEGKVGSWRFFLRLAVGTPDDARDETFVPEGSTDEAFVPDGAIDETLRKDPFKSIGHVRDRGQCVSSHGNWRRTSVFVSRPITFVVELVRCSLFSEVAKCQRET